MDVARAISIGHFVLVAYETYEGLADQTNLKPTVPLPAGFDLVAWITMEDFIFRPGDERERRFFGYLAHETGTDRYVIAIRGTEGWREWWDDFHVLLVPFHAAADRGNVAHGFAAIYSTLDMAYVTDGAPAAAPTAAPNLDFASKVGAMVRRHQGERFRKAGRNITDREVDLSQAQISITGHSLGAALVTLFIMQNDAKAHGWKLRPREAYTFASPRVGDAAFVACFNALPMESWRIYNEPDIVPKLPLEITGFEHVDRAYAIDTRKDRDIKWSFACWHSMYAYIAALGGPPLAAGSDCHSASYPAGLQNPVT